MTTDAWGIDDGYHSFGGDWIATSPETRATFLRAMSAEGDTPPPAPLKVVEQGQIIAAEGAATLILEDGAPVAIANDTLPPDVPPGYHTLQHHDGAQTRLILAPRRCFLPERLHTWGWAAQLYAARSRQSWGIGDLADLRHLARWSARDLGAGTLLINPLAAANCFLPQQRSPYYPSSRRFRNPLYLRIEEVPGAREQGSAIEPIAAVARSCNGRRIIDRDLIFRVKDEALRLLWTRFPGSDRFDRYVLEQGKGLHEYAAFCALSEQFQSGWHNWPEEYRHPKSPAVARFVEANPLKVRYHQWLQWLLDEQLEAATGDLTLMQDLPVGADPDGADAWAWQDLFAKNMGFGAPPDPYSAAGQDWGLQPFVPHKLRAAAYEPFVQIIRSALRHTGGLRIDHVMGLFRLFWIPNGQDARSGSYVRYRADELLAIVAVESHRSRSFIVGEDLGTVEPGVRETLTAKNILSYRLVWFEDAPPEHYPELALSAITTHDLPTIAGLWTGNDARAQEERGLDPNRKGQEEIKKKLANACDTSHDAPAENAIDGAYSLLARTPSMIVTASLEDAFAVEERPNMPGTVDEWPNWSIALPRPIEDVEHSPIAARIAEKLKSR